MAYELYARYAMGSLGVAAVAMLTNPIHGAISAAFKKHRCEGLQRQRA